MKVLSLHIENIRGIKKIDLKPDGKNYVIFGPNGTGKSAVVDALDFLFTGRISRLLGEGTSGITLTKHGCHIDTKPKDTVVQAVIEIPGCKETFELKRTISDPNTLNILKGDKSKLSDILKIATRGHHVLSRRDILRYVAAKRGERAKEIQALLNLDKVEKLRQFFVSVETDAYRRYQTSKAQFNSARRDIGHYLSIIMEKFSEEKIIERINELRKILNGSPVSVLEEEIIKKDLSPPTIPVKEKAIDPNFIKSNAREVLTIICKESKKIRESEIGLISKIKQLTEDETLKKELQSMRLLQLGISLLDESGRCPLCEKEWDPAELRKKIENRLLSAKRAREIQKQQDDLLDYIKQRYDYLKGCLINIEKCLDVFALKDMKPKFQVWLRDIDQHLSSLSDAENKIDVLEKSIQKPEMFIPENIENKMSAIVEKAETEGKKLTEEQKAWVTLTQLEPLIRIYRRTKKKFEKSEIAYKRANLLRMKYEDAKDKILNKLYNKIRDDFVEFYRFMHGKDEDKFDADFKARGAELIIEVDFYGRGKFPPLALHSEGHQDSMGVCLYLALVKLLSEGKILFTILDDVVMSIDSNHRRAFSQLLLKYFPNRQFFITTHNRTWARQLQTDGIVQSKNMIEKQKDGS